MMGIPFDRCDLDPEFRGSFEHKGLVIERWIYTSEPGSKVTALLYRPKKIRGLVPGMVITNGHGNSKSSANTVYSSVMIQELKPWHSAGGPEINREFTTEYMRSRSPRIVQKINNNWTFNYFPDETLDEHPASVDYNDSSWPAVAIPHSWHNYETTKQLHPFILNASEKNTSFFGDESGIGNPAYWWHGWGWYRKSFEIKNLVKDKRIFLEFEGVIKYCKVYLNGKYLGDHKGGFNSFYFDISDPIQQEGKNVLAVAVRNKLNDEFRIPPMHSGNQTHSGGIYRNVRIVVKNPVYIPFQGSYKHEGGTFVTTPVVNQDSAVVDVKTWIKNDTKRKRKVLLKTTIEDATGKEICTAHLDKIVNPGEIEPFQHVQNGYMRKTIPGLFMPVKLARVREIM
ncbi:MAG: beta galactosidase jelly roll domain-containing protein [candidate division KSB1 bacterium]|nr:beta galactosidase jelly roll domain-containing protein [candidate division KSB1 bacterium]